MKEQTRKDMQQKLADYRQPAPDISWSELETALAANRKPNRIPMWARLTAAAAVVLVVAGLGWQLLKTDNHTNEQEKTASTAISSTNDSTEETTAQDETQQAATEQDEDDGLSPLQDRIHEPRLVARVENMTENHEDETAASAVGTENADAAGVVDSHDETEQPTPQDHQTAEQQDVVNTEKKPPIKQHVVDPSMLQRRLAAQKNRLTAKVYYSNSFSDFNSMTAVPQPEMAYAATFYVNLNDSNSMDNASSKEMAAASGINGNQHAENGPLPKRAPNAVNKEHADHHQPIRLGLSVRYQLTNRWSVETGLTYTYLSSDIKQKYADNPFLFMKEQKLHYIGIPVNAEYMLWENKHFNVYASAGATVEKMVKGRRESKNSSQTEKVSIHPLQFSLNCAAGAELKLGNTFSIYAEPGLAYYFDNHSNVPTYYQDKPLGFNMNLGVRIKFRH